MIAARIGDDDATPGDAPFAELTNKLTELGYTAGDAIDGITTYAHPDGDGVRVTPRHRPPAGGASQPPQRRR